MIKENVEAILQTLRATYPRPYPHLHYNNNYQLLVAAILSAQTTDEQVNKVTPGLFRRYPEPSAMAAAEPEEIAPLIKNLGLFRVKSAYLVSACRILRDKFGGQVPNNFAELITLPGVGRKVANVILSNAFGQDVIAVDTHVFRVANRLGLARSNNVLEVEKQLLAILPPGTRREAHHLLIYHGRKVCQARKPRCQVCGLHCYCQNRSL